MDCQDSLSPNSLAVLAAIVSILISNGFDPSDLNVLGNFIVAVGSIILTIAAQEENLKNKSDSEQQKQLIDQQIETLKKQIELMQKQINGS